MKKIICCTLILLAALLIGCAAAGAETTTVLLYMCGTDLQSDACVDMVEVAEVEAGDMINTVILAGGAKEWDFDDLKGNTRNLTVIRDGYFEEVTNWGKKSMGSAESLQEFLEYGLTQYPADRMIVILWDHGAGSEAGVCFDETANDDGLSIVEIDQVLTAVQQKVPDSHINIFGCDACMMGTYEMAAMLSSHDIGYYVASEELEPGTGWNYTGWLQPLKDDPSMTDEEICGWIIESFMEQGLQENPDDYLTLSAIKLSEMPALVECMERFAASLSGEVKNGNYSAVRRGRSRLYTFGSFDDGSWDMVDLGAALNAYAQFDSASATEAKRLLKSCVILNQQTDNLDTCCGLSVLIPQDTAQEFGEYCEGFDISDEIPNWVGFVNDYVGALTGGSYHISSTPTTQIGQGSSFGEGTWFLPSSSCTTGCMTWDDETESYSEQYEAEIEIEDSDQGFTAVLSQEDLANLDYVEGMLLMDISDDDTTAFVDFGLMQNNLIDWKTGTVVSLYDGSWPIFGDQPVPLYDQSSNENSRRSLIPVKLNGQYTYLVVVFPAGSMEGRVVGANAGYDENGLPIRNMTKLNEGDKIVPVYTMYIDNGGDDLDEQEFDGDEIIWHDGMTVTYENLSDGTETTEMYFCFVFNDIFGDETMSEMIAFSI